MKKVRKKSNPKTINEDFYLKNGEKGNKARTAFIKRAQAFLEEGQE